MQTEAQREQIQLLNHELTQIGDARTKIDLMLKEKLSREDYLYIQPAIDGVLLFVQSNIAKRIRSVQQRHL